MQINHSFDIAPELGSDLELLSSTSYFAEEKSEAEAGFDCAGTVGTFGSMGGCAGTFGTFGCCC